MLFPRRSPAEVVERVKLMFRYNAMKVKWSYYNTTAIMFKLIMAVLLLLKQIRVLVRGAGTV